MLSPLTRRERIFAACAVVTLLWSVIGQAVFTESSPLTTASARGAFLAQCRGEFFITPAQQMPPSITALVGEQNIPVLSFVAQAGPEENIIMKKMSFTLLGGLAPRHIKKMRLVDAQGIDLSPAIFAPDQNGLFSFDGGFTIAPRQPLTMTLLADLADNAPLQSQFFFELTDAAKVSSFGEASGIQVRPYMSQPITGNRMIVSQDSFSAGFGFYNPPFRNIPRGTLNVPFTNFILNTGGQGVHINTVTMSTDIPPVGAIINGRLAQVLLDAQGNINGPITVVAGPVQSNQNGQFIFRNLDIHIPANTLYQFTFIADSTPRTPVGSQISAFLANANALVATGDRTQAVVPLTLHALPPRNVFPLRGNRVVFVDAQ